MPTGENGPTRREVDALTKRVDNIDEHGSRRVGVIEADVKGLREDVVELKVKMDSNTKALWSLIVVFLMGTVSLIVALASNVFG